MTKRARSRRLDPAVKEARKQFRAYLHVFKFGRATLSPSERAQITRRFTQVMVMDVIENFPEQLDVFAGIDPALKAAQGEQLEALALKIAELRNRLHATPGGVRSAVIH